MRDKQHPSAALREVFPLLFKLIYSKLFSAVIWFEQSLYLKWLCLAALMVLSPRVLKEAGDFCFSVFEMVQR